MPSCCGWNGYVCQFQECENTVSEIEGSTYCLAHLPLNALQKNLEAFKAFLTECLNRGHRDFSGTAFPGGSATSIVPYDLRTHALALRRCEFGAYIQLNLHSGNWSESHFRGDAEIIPYSGDANLSGCEFHGPLTFHGVSGGFHHDFKGSRFRGTVEFRGAGTLKALRFDDCVFEAVPTFTPAALPQQTIFTDVRFERTAQRSEDEGAYRAIRNLFNANRAREWEGWFYAHEKRCHRQSLPWRTQWFPRFLSWLYDIAARYGQSYERALVVFMLLQLAFGLGYAYFSGRLDIGGQIDADVITFTASQVVKPFELFSARLPLAPAFASVIPESARIGWWAFWTFLHSVLSLTLIALFLIAVRWRFRRE